MRKAYLTAVLVLTLSSAAQALTLMPGDEYLNGNDPSQAAINAILASYGIDTELYKDNVGGSEEGIFAAYYTTTYDSADPKDAVITWDGSGNDFISDAGYLLVKDGHQVPAWYLFDIHGWDGKETIYLNNFWPQQGAISHVAIYEGDGGKNEVPEPATMLLLGTGIAGLAGLRRRQARK